MLFSSMTGIDIGHHSIKAVVMKTKSEQLQLMNFKEIPSTPSIFLEKQTLAHEPLVTRLKQLKKQLPFGVRNIVLSVPESAVISKVLQIDSDLDDKEQEFAIHHSFAQQSPLPLEELSIDYVPIHTEIPDTEGSSATYQVYATRKEVISSRINACKAAGFYPKVIDIHSSGLLKLWQFVAQQQNRFNWMLVDVGLSQTSLCLLPRGRAAYYREMALGTQQMKGNQSELSNPTCHDALLEEFVTELADRLSRQMSLYRSVQHQQSIEGIWLTGGGACFPNIEMTLSIKLGVPVMLLNPFGLVERHKTLSLKQSSLPGSCFGGALGLAIRGMQWAGGRYAA
ncbi:type IV pilus assembly protein PilM [Vibrio sp. Of7-15]|uniref:type IV pilus assembly protein PilM n=1 Tax=Vibrio sp. Of7-15 TaxID=2724879 RepID=UPI001EF322EF|nr:type IV pilus assembly protein PilM [Vibrio sp. Of7-15]MCG7496917.1 type IV pilus assembly protein PilM [Vibrio sp. Of7-15]